MNSLKYGKLPTLRYLAKIVVFGSKNHTVNGVSPHNLQTTKV